MGRHLAFAWAVMGGNRIHLRLPRELIYSITIYNDPILWEIERYKADLKHSLLANLDGQARGRLSWRPRLLSDPNEQFLYRLLPSMGEASASVDYIYLANKRQAW
jgi:hypothetical protein